MTAAELTDLYWMQDLTLRKIGAMYGHTQQWAWSRMKKFGIRCRTISEGAIHSHKNDIPSCNIQKFMEWTPESAYFLGFLYTDGFITIRPQYRCHKIGFMLQRKDRYILEWFKSYFGIRANVIDGISKGSKNWKGNKTYLNSKLHFNNKKLAIYLKNFGAKRAEIINKIPKDLFYDFLTGVLDGDGWARKFLPKGYKKEQYHFGICGQKDFIELLGERLGRNIRKCGTIWAIDWTQGFMKTIGSKMYKSFGLKRKKDIVNECLNLKLRRGKFDCR